jgi:cytochrome o ubiquinol oxidase subunit 1
VIIGGVLFGLFAAINYWWPKAFGFKLDVFWGKISFWCWVVGFWVAFTPLYVLGLMGVTRRMRVFDDPSLQIWFVIAGIGAAIIAAGIGAMLVQFAVSIWRRKELREESGDPWDGRTLEWATSSPPPDYNFAFTPVIHDLDAWYDMKKRGHQRPVDGYRDIHMPSNTGAGMILSGICLVMGFALVWHIWWLVAASFVAVIAAAIIHTFNYKRDFDIPAATVTAVEEARTRQLAAGA